MNFTLVIDSAQKNNANSTYGQTMFYAPLSRLGSTVSYIAHWETISSNERTSLLSTFNSYLNAGTMRSYTDTPVSSILATENVIKTVSDPNQPTSPSEPHGI